MEGTKLQLASDGGQTHSIIVSTLAEAWKVVDGGLVSDGIVKDVGLSSTFPLLKGLEDRLLLRFFMDCLCPLTNWMIFRFFGMRFPHSVQSSGSS